VHLLPGEWRCERAIKNDLPKGKSSQQKQVSRYIFINLIFMEIQGLNCCLILRFHVGIMMDKSHYYRLSRLICNGNLLALLGGLKGVKS